MPNAIHPNYFKDFRKETKVEKEAPLELREEKALADVGEMGGWKVLKEWITDLKVMLDKILETSIEGGASFEEIGQKTMVVALAKSYLDQVIDKVEDSKEAVANEVRSEAPHSK